MVGCTEDPFVHVDLPLKVFNFLLWIGIQTFLAVEMHTEALVCGMLGALDGQDAFVGQVDAGYVDGSVVVGKAHGDVAADDELDGPSLGHRVPSYCHLEPETLVCRCQQPDGIRRRRRQANTSIVAVDEDATGGDNLGTGAVPR